MAKCMPELNPLRLISINVDEFVGITVIPSILKYSSHDGVHCHLAAVIQVDVLRDALKMMMLYLQLCCGIGDIVNDEDYSCYSKFNYVKRSFKYFNSSDHV